MLMKVNPLFDIPFFLELQRALRDFPQEVTINIARSVVSLQCGLKSAIDVKNADSLVCSV